MYRQKIMNKNIRMNWFDDDDMMITLLNILIKIVYSKKHSKDFIRVHLIIVQ